MCNLSEAIEERGIEQGIAIGQQQSISKLIMICQKIGGSYEEVSINIAKVYKLSDDKVKEYMDDYWEQN